MLLAMYLKQGESKMLKITRQQDETLKLISFKLEGRLAGPWVEELKACWRRTAPDSRNRAVVDLTNVTFVDADGKALLTAMWQKGVRLHATGCLNNCIVEEITKASRAGSSRTSRKSKVEGN